MQSMKWWQVVGRLMGSLALLGSISCGHQAGVEASAPAFAEDHSHLPFERPSDKTGVSPTASIPPSEIPAGTVLTVRIQSHLSSAGAEGGDLFQAVLDSPIDVDGLTVVPRNTLVKGEVLVAKAASSNNEFGYVRLELTSIILGDKAFPLHTAGIFVKGPSAELHPRASALASRNQASSTKDVEFPSARPLTFLVTQAVATRK
jgi:hypothetical protein